MDRATGEKGPVTEFKLGTYALSRSFSHELSVPVSTKGRLGAKDLDWDR